MKTTKFIILRAFIILANTGTIINSLALACYLVYSFRFMNVESTLMTNCNLTIPSIGKILCFSHSLISLYVLYSTSIPSTFAMLVSSHILKLSLFGSAFFIYYLCFEYPAYFTSNIKGSAYFSHEVGAAIQSWSPDKNSDLVRTDAITEIKRLCKLIFIYESINAGVALMTIVFLRIIRKIKIEKPSQPLPPPISELSKVGLNTQSLRNKHIVMSHGVKELV